MKIRHLTAITLVGWYLMYPPLKYGDHPQEVPLGRWLIKESFDSAQPCEQARQSLIAGRANHLVNEDGLDEQAWGFVNQAMPSEQRTPFNGTKMAAQVFAACIATDDPRLAK